MPNIASIIMAAGRGSRMKAFDGNKTLLPLVPGETPFEGGRPILLQIIQSLPCGPKCVIVNYKKDEVIKATCNHGLSYCEQPELNGTGGALLAASDFIEGLDSDFIIITMGDVPFVKPRTYQRLFQELEQNSMAVLGFIPADKKQYGILETSKHKVTRIIEWKYWSAFPKAVQEELPVCNSGIYAVRIKDLLRYLPVLASRPQVVVKDRNGVPTEIKEYFITDIVEYMVKDGLSVGCVIAEDEMEAMGIDDPAALEKAQGLFMEQKLELPCAAVLAALEAGREILSVYRTDFDIEHKEDKSPLTLADKQAHQVITRALSRFQIPILSEEGKGTDYRERKSWERLWIVDPLDGTKEFIKRNGEFTVNIALVISGKPVLGVVYWPVKDILYLGALETGAYKIEKASSVFKNNDAINPLMLLNQKLEMLEKLPLKHSKPSVFTIVGSRSHPSPELEALVDTLRKQHGEIEFISAGSSLKICLVAEGAADLYPRLGPTMEWDTAAGQAVAEASGATVLDYTKDIPLEYNKENLLNPWFVVKR